MNITDLLFGNGQQSSMAPGMGGAMSGLSSLFPSGGMGNGSGVSPFARASSPMGGSMGGMDMNSWLMQLLSSGRMGGSMGGAMNNLFSGATPTGGTTGGVGPWGIPLSGNTTGTIPGGNVGSSMNNDSPGPADQAGGVGPWGLAPTNGQTTGATPMPKPFMRPPMGGPMGPNNGSNMGSIIQRLMQYR